jgi:concanavalin A-like lectin/glucanase superfamily protein
VRWLVALWITGCGFAPAASPTSNDGGGSGAPPADAGPHFRKVITLAVNSPTELRDFPISIITRDPDLEQMAQPDASDIAFTTLDGAPLAYELVSFDKPSGALEAWVRIPSVTASTQIALVYGGSSIASSGTVWSPSIYAAAWHFAETSGPWMDSAGGHRVTPPSAGSTAAVVPGIAGSARQFDGIDDATQADPAESGLDFGTSSFTVQAWVNVAHSADAYDMVIDKGGDVAKPGYCFTLGTGNWYAEVGDDNYIAATFGSELSLLGHWTQLTAVIDRTSNNLLAYTNGAFSSSLPFGTIGSVDGATPLAIGSMQSEYRFEGIVDEIRVVKVALSADWIAAEWRNATMRSQFVTYGSPAQF